MTALAPVVHWDHPYGGLICGEDIHGNWHTANPRRVTCALCRLEVETRLRTLRRNAGRVIYRFVPQPLPHTPPRPTQ